MNIKHSANSKPKLKANPEAKAIVQKFIDQGYRRLSAREKRNVTRDLAKPL